MPKKRIAVLPILEIHGKQKVFLVTSRISGQWILPTGKYENLLSNKQVAVLEAFEEAGVAGSIDKKYCKKLSMRVGPGLSKRKLRLYRMTVDKVHSQWPEKGQRRRVLVPLNKLPEWISNKRYAQEVMRFAAI